jgi:hypothetical protein
MPYLIRRPRVRRSFCALVGAFILTVLTPAVANACTVSSGGSQVFKSVGDMGYYTLVQGGSFEAGATGWSLTGAAVSAGGASGSRSLTITPSGNAVSPPICVGISTPTFRFVARRASGTWAQMNVNVLWTDALGVAHSTTAGSASGMTSWTVSPVMLLGAMLPLWQSGSTLSVRLQFLPAQYGGSWAIDDVYVDPYSRG